MHHESGAIDRDVQAVCRAARAVIDIVVQHRAEAAWTQSDYDTREAQAKHDDANIA